jgi:hypothetical protein
MAVFIETDSVDFDSGYDHKYARFILDKPIHTNSITIRLEILKHYIHIGSDDVYYQHRYDDYPELCNAKKATRKEFENMVTGGVNLFNSMFNIPIIPCGIFAERGLYSDTQLLRMNKDAAIKEQKICQFRVMNFVYKSNSMKIYDHKYLGIRYDEMDRDHDWNLHIRFAGIPLTYDMSESHSAVLIKCRLNGSIRLQSSYHFLLDLIPKDIADIIAGYAPDDFNNYVALKMRDSNCLLSLKGVRIHIIINKN